MASRTPLTLTEEGRTQQCNRLIEAINEQQARIRDAKTDDAAAMRALAVSLREIVELVGNVQVQSAPLLSFRKRYMLLLSDFARTAEGTAEAMDAKDLDLLRQAQVDLRDIGPRETALVKDINRYCQVEGDDDADEDERAPDAEATMAAAEACQAGEEKQCEVAVEGFIALKNWTKLVEVAEHACNQGRAQVCAMTGMLYFIGVPGFKADKHKSVSWSARGCLGGVALGCVTAGKYFVEYPAKVEGVDGATILFARTCGAGHGAACVELKTLYPGGNLPQTPIVTEPLERGCRGGVSGTCELLEPRQSTK